MTILYDAYGVSRQTSQTSVGMGFSIRLLCMSCDEISFASHLQS